MAGSVDASGEGRLKNGIVRFVTSALVSQARLAKELFLDARFRAPLISIWVATAGGALHDPVTTFFYLELGITSVQLGYIQAIALTSAFALSPVYGYYLDTRGSYIPLLLSCFLCGLGCLIRCIATNVTWLYVGAAVLGLGGGNLWTITLTHLTVYAEESRRSTVVAAFTFQVTTLRILGKAAYPAWNHVVQHMLGIEDTLFRYRIHMSTCVFMCFFGFLWMFFVDGVAVKNLKPRAASTNQNQIDEVEALIGETRTQTTQSAVTKKREETKLKRKAFVVLFVALMVQASAEAAVTTLWPLYVKDSFHFGPTGFSYMLLSCTVFSAGMLATISNLGNAYGDRRVLLSIMVGALVGSLVAFRLHSPFWPLVVLHTVFATVFFACCTSMDPLIKSMTTFVVPPSYAGRMFSLLSVATGIGKIGANLAATRIYGGKADPFMGVSIALAMGIGLVFLLPTRNSSTDSNAATLEQKQKAVIEGRKISPQKQKTKMRALKVKLSDDEPI